MSWDKYNEALASIREQHTVDDRFAACDDLMYTLKRLGYVDRVTRATKARELFIWHVDGPEGLEKHRTSERHWGI